jgi:putative oxidoreductase
MFPSFTRLADMGFLLLRLMVGLVFIVSGWSDVRQPEERSKSLGTSRDFTLFLGIAEIAGSLGIMFGVFTQLAAIGLILLMFGAIDRKIRVWKTGFWGEKSQGWHYGTRAELN